MMHLTIAAWVTFGLAAIISTLLLKLTVRVLAKNADNGWDNALAYGVATLLIAIPVSWMLKSGSWLLYGLAPLFVWAGQTIALRVIYQVRTLRAWAIGVVHATVTGTACTALALGVAFVAAYILYGKIISDPMFLIRLLLRLIGLDVPDFTA
jgi:hypothetical protein